MFVILTYDVSAKRDPNFMKISRKYLSHCQKSVFEGMITESKLKRLKREIEKVIQYDEDSIRIYEFDSLKYARKEELGRNSSDSNIL